MGKDKNTAEEPSVGYGQPLNFEKVWLMFKETDKKFKETDSRFKETDKEFQETKEELRETGRYIKELSKNLGGIGNSNGYYAEQFFAIEMERARREIVQNSKGRARLLLPRCRTIARNFIDSLKTI